MKLKGIFAASASILSEDLSLNVSETLNHAEKLILDGCHNVALLGSTGQAQYLKLDEKKEFISQAAESKFKNNFLIGTGINSLKENVDFMKHSIKNGFNYFLIMNPPYYKYSDEGTFLFFSEIINKVPDSKIVLYNFEKLSGYAFSIEIIERLVDAFPKQIVGVKDSTYNVFEKLKIPNFSIFPGSETKLLKGLELGCSGIISAVCNVTATLARKVYDDYQNKNIQTFNDKLCNVRKLFDNHNLISAVHAFLANENKKFNKLIPPLQLLNKKDKKILFTNLEKVNFYPKKNIAA